MDILYLMHRYRASDYFPRYMPSFPGRKTQKAFRRVRLGRRQVRIFRPMDHVEITSEGARKQYGIVVSEIYSCDGQEFVNTQTKDGVVPVPVTRLRRMK